MPVWPGAQQLSENLITLREASKQSGLSMSHLRLLAKTGRLQARKMGRDWVTTAEAVERYMADTYLRSRNPYKSREPTPKN
jgi:excisionase family DNA binding protein